MKKYTVLFSKIASKELRNLPDNILKKVFAKSKELKQDPRPPGCKN